LFEGAAPLALAVLELLHPTWPDGSVAQGVAAAGVWWVPLHVLLIAGYGVLALCLSRVVPDRPRTYRLAARISLLAFVACNTIFLAIDGLAVGLLASTDPTSADTLWNSPAVQALANLTGATWALTLLLVAPMLHSVTLASSVTAGQTSRVMAPLTPTLIAGLALTWLTFTASSYLPGAALASRAAAIATGAWATFTEGASTLPFALLVFAAVLHQHAGPEAALGMLCLALALAARRPSRTSRGTR
jgi:hypothetical protein